MRNLAFFCSLALLTAIPSAAGAAAAEKRGQNVTITVVSSPPDMISGGDALVHIDVPAGVSATKVLVKLNDAVVTADFHPDPMGHGLLGLVEGIRFGQNTLAVFTDGKGKGTAAQQLALKNYAITGPIFSGPQEKPFICQTQSFKMPDGTTLGAPIDENCSVQTVVNYVYKPAAATGAKSSSRPAPMKVLTNLTQLPPDVEWTTTTAGAKVPYVVRVETGTINRSIYQIAVLHDPTSGTVSPLAPPKAWNGRLLYSFGGGCPGGWYRQGNTLGAGAPAGAASAVISDNIVGKGYAEAGSSLNVAGNQCNDVISAETMMMVKEHFIKTVGKPAFTFGRGGSGGSYQQSQITDNYPGLLDGIIPSLTFSDVQELTQMITDSRLLQVYFDKIGATLTDEQKRAVGGVAELQNITASAIPAGRINTFEYCPPELPMAQRYDPLSNISGVRCDIYDHNISIYGRDPATGFARRPIDNTGVQYGLAALNDGAITPAQFLDLNANIGGYDNDGRIVASRSVADTLALRNAYQSGVITSGVNGLSELPIIDVRPYRDKLRNGDEHEKYHSFAYRERLRKANGTIDNEVMLLGPVPGEGTGPSIDDYAIVKMDEWLTALTKDTSGDPILHKIARAKPADLVDSCWTPTGERIIETQTFSGGKCNGFYPTFGGPRMAAGEPVANDVLKCQLKPVDAGDYAVPFSDAQKRRLVTIFPAGVCDWNKPGVEQQAPIGTWQSHMNGPAEQSGSMTNRRQ
jgi:hypothetical protein